MTLATLSEVLRPALSGGYAVAALGFQRFFLIPAALFCGAGVVSRGGVT